MLLSETYQHMLVERNLKQWLAHYWPNIIHLPVFASLAASMKLTQDYIDAHPEVLDIGASVFNQVTQYLMQHPDLLEKIANAVKAS